MGCLVVLFALISPRLALILTWLANDILSRAFGSWLLPLIGFFILPWTTLTYAWLWNWGEGREVTGWEWILVVVAVIADLGALGGARRRRD